MCICVSDETLPYARYTHFYEKKKKFNDLILPPPIQLIVRRLRWSLIISLSHPPSPLSSLLVNPLQIDFVISLIPYRRRVWPMCWVLRRGCLTMRCRNRRTKGRRGPQTRSREVWWRRMTSLFQDKVAAIGVMRHWLTLLVFCMWLYIHLHVSPSVNPHAGRPVVVSVFTIAFWLYYWNSLQFRKLWKKQNM